MSKFDRYILAQCMSVFGFFTLIFVLLIWINRTVILFDELIGDGQSAWVFLEFSSRALPGAVATILPLSSFAATLYITNRLSNESELTVMQATGASPWRSARPFAIFGIITALLLSVFTLYLAPAASQKQAYREKELSSDLATKLLKDGVFQHPAQGVTLYIREILPTGELLDIYVADRREKQTSVTYTAQTAYVLKEREDTVLVMKDGYIQNYEHATNTLSVTKFDDMTYNFGADAFDTTLDHLAISQVETTTILFDPEAAQKISKRDAAFVNEELHKRLFNPTLAFAAALVGFASIYFAGFSRFGVGQFVLFAIFLLVVMKMIESGLTGPTRTVYELWPLIYAPSVFGILASIFMLFYSQRPRKVAPPDIGGEPA